MSRAENPFARGRAWVDSAKIAGIGRQHLPTNIHHEEEARHAKIEQLAKLFQQTHGSSSPVIEGKSELVPPLHTPARESATPSGREV